MPILNPHGLPQMKVMGLIGFWYWVNKQWGRTAEGNNITTQYPIAFTSFCTLAVTMCSSNGNAASSVFRNGFGYTSKGLTSWTFRGATGDAKFYFDYIAAGK